MLGRIGLFYLCVLCIPLLCTSCETGENHGSYQSGPHNKPDEVVRAYVDAILTDDCKRAESLVVPDRRDTGRQRVLQECANAEAPFLVSAIIEDILIEEWDGVTIVTLFGDFYTDLGPQIHRQAYNGEIVFSTEEVDGKWYVKP